MDYKSPMSPLLQEEKNVAASCKALLFHIIKSPFMSESM